MVPAQMLWLILLVCLNCLPGATFFTLAGWLHQKIRVPF